VAEVLDEDSRVEGCFKNKKVFIEELSSADHVKNNAVLSADLCLETTPPPPRAGVILHHSRFI